MKEAIQIAAAILVLPVTLGGLIVFLRWYPDYEKRHLEKSE